jgi:hypothetical protein
MQRNTAWKIIGGNLDGEIIIAHSASAALACAKRQSGRWGGDPRVKKIGQASEYYGTATFDCRSTKNV